MTFGELLDVFGFGYEVIDGRYHCNEMPCRIKELEDSWCIKFSLDINPFNLIDLNDLLTLMSGYKMLAHDYHINCTGYRQFSCSDVVSGYDKAMNEAVFYLPKTKAVLPVTEFEDLLGVL